MIVLAGGVTLHAARAAVGVTLDRWVPRIEQAVPDVPPEPLTAVSVPEPSIEGVVEPEWTYVDIEAAIRPLPENTEALISEGRDELSQFTDLNSADEARALLIRNRWRLWGRIWHNRVDHARGPIPPAEVCNIHAALEPTCRALRESLSMLAKVPSVNRVSEARELLDGATAILEQLRQAQAEELEEASSLSESSGAANPPLDSGVP